MINDDNKHFCVEVNDLVNTKLREGRGIGGKKMWSCAECGFERKERHDVARHIEQHLNLSIPCSICRAIFTRRDKLKSHMKHKHSTLI